MKKILRKLYYRLIRKPHLISSDGYVNWLRNKGIKVGNGTYALNLHNISIDLTRPELIEIGKNVFIHSGTTIMSHDWASWCFVNKYNEFIPSHGKVKIGNNVWLGENVTILKNVTIGDNVIIGAGSIVTKSIPSNSVAVGSPAKVISSIDEYLKKRNNLYVDEAIEYAIAIYDSGRIPQKEDFYDDYPAFVDGRNYNEYDYPYLNIFSREQFEQWKRYHHAPFFGFDEFMKAVNEQRVSK